MSRVDLAPVSDRRRWHIDHINKAPTADEAFRRATEWVRAELRDCQLRRPADADGFRWQLIHLLAAVALEIHRSHPAGEFRSTQPKLPGGGWEPKPGSNVQLP